VFRLWPNGRDHRLGGSLTVSAVQVDGAGVTPQQSPAGARTGTPGTLLTLPLGRTAPAGTPIVAAMDFTLRLPPAFLDRLGSDGHTAWWGTGFPLLAWMRGQGWVRTPGSSTMGEMAVSEAARTDVTVTAPRKDTVLATGAPSPPVTVSPTQRRWQFTSETARDVAVAVGPLSLATVTVHAGKDILVRMGSAPGLTVSNQEALQGVERALPLLVSRYGPYPYSTLDVAAVPGINGSGVEYPGMFFLGGSSDQSVITHELVHMWFYGLVGNDQELHPWLDEAFATVGEEIVDAQLFGGAPLPADPLAVGDARPVDSPVKAFEHDELGYDTVVYEKGAAALLAARQQAGPVRFDAALRCYVKAHAWQVSTPADFAAALRGLPKAVAVLRKAGAIRG
jgi:hypothetical protein